MIVLVDADNVLFDYTGGLIHTTHELFSRWVFREEITSWAIFEHLGLNTEQLAELHETIYDAGWCAALEPLPGATMFVEELRARDCQIKVVTTADWSSPTWCYERTHALKHHFGIEPHTVTFTAEKEDVMGDVLIDDNEVHVRRWAAKHPTGQSLLFARPHNKRATDLVRVGNYPDVLAMIDNHDPQVLRCKVR